MNTTDASRSDRSRPEHGEPPRLFGPPPLFDGEDTEIYDRILTQVSATVRPADIFEDIWVHDFVDITFDVLRLRRLRAALMTANAYNGLRETLTPLLGCSRAQTLSEAWAAHKPDVIAEVNKTLTSAGLSTDSILAQTFSLKLNDIERIENMMAVAEARRNATLHEIDRHRQTLGQKLRRVAEHFDDGQLRVIESTPTSIDG